jgi:cbb3-type cytochrome oxidase subunit 3
MKPSHKYALIGVVVLAVVYYVYSRHRRAQAAQAAKTLNVAQAAQAAQTWPPRRRLPDDSAATMATMGTATMGTAAATMGTAAAAATAAPGIIGVGAESPNYIAPIGKATAKQGICDSAFDDVASTLISANRVVDERIAPVISSKNGGLLPNLDVRGDYAAMMCVDEERADDCGIWNRSSAQRGIKLGYIKDTDRRRVVLAGP